MIKDLAMGIILNDPVGSKCNRQGPYKKEAEGPLMLFPIPLAKQVYTLAYLHKIWWVFFFFINKIISVCITLLFAFVSSLTTSKKSFSVTAEKATSFFLMVT